MKVLVVGGGGREHAIVRKLKESKGITEVLVAPGNGGIAAEAVCVSIAATNIPAMVEFAVKEKVEFVVVAPDDPLVLGMVDALRAVGIPAFGPSKGAAQIEGSKVFSKALMKKYGIPTASYEVFDDIKKAGEYLRTKNQFPIVIKADGLALGKGVAIPTTLEEAERFLSEIMEDKIFGESGSRVVIEEFLTGPEVTVLAFSDGNTIVPMVSSMDHKPVFDGNKGPNTGGMGTIAPNPHYSLEQAQVCMETIFKPTLAALAAEGAPFTGCLYFGLMLTPAGPKVIEYNCRFGDPEAQVVLPLLESDLFEIMKATTNGTLATQEIRWRAGAAACVMLASGGYPGEIERGHIISGLNNEGQLDTTTVTVYHSGTKKEKDTFVTAGGRVLGVTTTGTNLEQALHSAYTAVDEISFKGMHYRRDIGRL